MQKDAPNRVTRDRAAGLDTEGGGREKAPVLTESQKKKVRLLIIHKNEIKVKITI